MNSYAIIDRAVRRDDRCSRRDRVAALSFDRDAIAVVNGNDPCSRKNFSAGIDDRPRHPVEKFQWMKLRLLREAQHRLRIDVGIRYCIDANDITSTRPVN